LITGENLGPGRATPADYPRARLGRRQVPARASQDGARLYVAVPHDQDERLDDQPLTVALDPNAEITMRLRMERQPHDHAEEL
ncbi:hypothetical protein, partial [Enterococcus faecalis]|uniref:hypothetical protein n=1 Tax=Enterococcus faecalis TaxID=1351 RepID=UPI003D6B1269